ncbi:(2Fe-2S)-binding protein [Roseomonas sp. NAR14]|uniref:Bacterioferritin-associated ferredoxin n=1 Tax=Roseomonas acroporae TaxID=2937791 RepID=A0A9X1YCQ2_9PROT|nr:(2Fe-2S)-binding protein [Roseomonas acroporae]MCK8786302.1 (2Fe-2S)-binding protein [Roseomonas acroporae]
MYVCLCNALNERRLWQAIGDGAVRPGEVYALCGCRAQCGRCTAAILDLLRSEAAANARACDDQQQ